MLNTRPMTPLELEDAMRRLGIRSDAELARILQVDRATTGRWLKGERVIPGPVRVVVALLIAAEDAAATIANAGGGGGANEIG